LANPRTQLVPVLIGSSMITNAPLPQSTVLSPTVNRALTIITVVGVSQPRNVSHRAKVVTHSVPSSRTGLPLVLEDVGSIRHVKTAQKNPSVGFVVIFVWRGVLPVRARITTVLLSHGFTAPAPSTAQKCTTTAQIAQQQLDCVAGVLTTTTLPATIAKATVLHFPPMDAQ